MERYRPSGKNSASTPPASKPAIGPGASPRARTARVVAITPRGSELITAAAAQHVGDVRNVLIDHLSAAELDTLAEIGERVRERLALLEGEHRRGSGEDTPDGRGPH
jgi:hypothetical protein